MKIFIKSIIFSSIVYLLNCSTVNPSMYNSPGRDKWQKPDFVVESLKIKQGSKIADLGAGGGYFTYRFAQATGPKGIVYAVDIEQKNLDYIKENSKDKNLPQIQYILSEPLDSNLPEPVDLIFSCDSYHHFKDRIEFLNHLKTKLTKEGKIAIIDFKGNDSFFRPKGHFTEEGTIVSEMESAGLILIDKISLPKQNFLIFSVKKVDGKS